MKAISIQYGLPVKNPVDNVVVTRKAHVIHLEIPINYPDIHKVSFADLLDKHGVETSPIKVVHTPNNKSCQPTKDSIK